jgi:dethiobiotin synthetase
MTLFIAGTDTHCGKTTVTGLLARYFHEKKQAVVTQKWIQTGATDTPIDIHRHYAIMGVSPSLYTRYKKAICPYVLPLGASAHLAAEHHNIEIDPNRLLVAYSALKKQFDIVLVEGIGGLMVPLSRYATTADVLYSSQLPTLLVIKNELGCINHALLSLSFLSEHKMPILGIVFTRTHAGDSLIQDDNPRIISALSGGVPCFGELPFETDVDILYKKSRPIWEAIAQSIKSSR